MYNISMTTVTIHGAANALEAGQWCLNNCDKNEWKLSHMVPWGAEPSYSFGFNDPNRATEFILRWQR